MKFLYHLQVNLKFLIQYHYDSVNSQNNAKNFTE